MTATDALPARIVDAHHHLWDLSTGRYPWLQGPRQDPSDPSGIGPFQRTYLPSDLRADARGLPLVATVHVEAAWDARTPAAETRWLQHTADTTGLPSAAVAGAHLERPDLEVVLDRHQEYPIVRGVRQMLDWDPSPGARQPPALLDDAAWRAGLASLAPRGLSFDLQVMPSQLAAATELVRANPDLVVVLDHGGLHAPRGSVDEREWAAAVTALARCPNARVKTSGYDAVDPRWEPSGFRGFVRRLVDAFGPDRTMFASNFPIDRRTIGYRRLVELCAAALEDLGAAERDDYFAGTAARTYRIDLGHAAPL